MVEFSIIRHLLSDTESLSSYYQGIPATFEDIKRRLLLLDRRTNNMLPDQFYRLILERDLKDIDSLEGLIGTGLFRVADEYLAINGNKVIIRQNKQNQWQQLLTFLPPLLLKMALLFQKAPPGGFDPPSIEAYFDNYILPNTRYTSLPSAEIGELDSLLNSSQGFHDLHIHLNGSTEIDIAWQDFLSFPDKIYSELKRAILEDFVKEQLEQESTLLDPLKFYHLLKIARRIRNILFDGVTQAGSSRAHVPFDKFLVDIVTAETSNTDSAYTSHPFSTLLPTGNSIQNNMALEGLMYILIFECLLKKNNVTVVSLFHFYILIQGLVNRLLVQQIHQKGFQQFQKITLNGLRELSEKKYHQRFFQMHGNDLKFLAFLEGRFSPKETDIKNIALLNAIEKGWNHFSKEIKTINQVVIPTPVIKLVGHFIKRPDNNPDQFIRHKNLRLDTWKRGIVLSLLIKSPSKYKDYITGIDAAASEFDAPPEVFAPTFRFLRRTFTDIDKPPRFTYHVGEDFYHLLGGIRAIYEAVDFLELKKNDRIGHATAIGVQVDHWKSVIGDSILIRKGEWLDNLIFMYHYMTTSLTSLSIPPGLESEIRTLADSIYGPGTYQSITDLINAWLARKYCPILVSSDTHYDARSHSTYNLDEWESIQYLSLTATIQRLILHYHWKDTREKYNEIILIKTDDIFNLNYLQETQKSILNWLAEKEIVIETLPTSNVRIGNYKDYSEYHLYNWVKWKNENNRVPKIVVGTDDTGIFATNIYNEYANLWQYLIESKGQSTLEALKIIAELNTNANSYKFS